MLNTTTPPEAFASAASNRGLCNSAQVASRLMVKVLRPQRRPGLVQKTALQSKNGKDQDEVDGNTRNALVFADRLRRRVRLSTPSKTIQHFSRSGASTITNRHGRDIQCKLHITDLEESHAKYTAMSYAPSDTSTSIRVTVECDGSKIAITSALYSALH